MTFSWFNNLLKNRPRPAEMLVFFCFNEDRYHTKELQHKTCLSIILKIKYCQIVRVVS